MFEEEKARTKTRIIELSKLSLESRESGAKPFRGESESEVEKYLNVPMLTKYLVVLPSAGNELDQCRCLDTDCRNLSTEPCGCNTCFHL